ncbi:MAG: hypothetical protein J6D37_07725 [Clostridia bacterium]|nr:hypothetical protein [Clostridia bacterium]
MKRSKNLSHRSAISMTLCIIFTAVFMLGGCDRVELRGIEKYNRAISSRGISEFLIPIIEEETEASDFRTVYPYLEGDYFYIDKGVFSKHYTEHELMYLIYSPEVYEKAKSFALDSFPLSSIHRYRYNGYEFIENLSYAQKEYATLTKYNQKGYEYFVETGENLYFPDHFNMIAYHDEKKILLFLGFLFGENSMNEKDKLALDPFNIEAFLKEYFYFYDFDEA